MEQGCSGSPPSDESHRPLAEFAERCRACRQNIFRLDLRFLFIGRVPGFFLSGGEQRLLPEQCPHTVGPHFGGGMQPTEGPHPGEAARQGVLQETGHELHRFQCQRGVFAGLALAVTPADFAVGYLHSPAAQRLRSTKSVQTTEPRACSFTFLGFPLISLQAARRSPALCLTSHVRPLHAP